jgi:ribonuclease R
MKNNKSKLSSKERKQLRKSAIKYFKKNTQKKRDVNELANIMQLQRSQIPELKIILEILVKEDFLIKEKGGIYSRKPKQQIITGTLQVKPGGFGFVRRDDGEKDIFIRARNMGHAINKDTVSVELLAGSSGDLEEGKIIEIIERGQLQFPGIFHKTKYYSFVSPLDNRFKREFMIPDDKTNDARDGEVVVCQMVEWEEKDANPVGEIVRILGEPDDPKIDIESLMVSYNVAEEFPAEVQAEAEKKQLLITEKSLSGRLDLREMTLFTIDPEDAKDFDDAVSLQKLDNGNYYLGVHIADVSYFVEENSELDKHAFKRGNSVYLVDRVIPMLPEYLSNGLCSLKPNQDRFAFSCFMELDNKLNLISYEIKPSVINSKRRYNYQEVQDILDDAGSRDQFASELKMMWELGKKLNEKRMKNGAIDFETPEVKIILDEEGTPVEIVPRLRLNSMRLIEEFMLMANQTIAMHIERLTEKRIRLPFIYRVHEHPSPEKIERFVKFLNVLGQRITPERLQNVKDFQKVIDIFHNTPEKNLVEEVALRTMMKAQYATKNIGHYGLGFKYYTHFTSPIRRYADLWVHRLLKEYEKMVGKERQEFLKKHLNRVADQVNAQEINAQQAERESIKLKQIEYIEQYIGEDFEGVISGVTEFGLFISLKNLLIEGLVHIRDLDDDYYVFDEAGMFLIGRHRKQRYRLGDPVKVKVLSANKESRNIDFILVQEKKKKSSAGKDRKKSIRKKKSNKEKK